MLAVSVRTESRTLDGMCTACPVAMSTAIVSPTARPTPRRTAASEPGSRRREEHAVDELPPRGAQRETGLAVRVRHRLERVLSDRDDHRHAHEREDDAAVEDVHADRGAGQLTMSLLITVSPTNPHTTLGIAASSSMTTFSVSRTRGRQNSER